MAASAIVQILNRVEIILKAISGIGDVKLDGADALFIQSFPAAVIGTSGTEEPDQLLNDWIDWHELLTVTCHVSAETDLRRTLEAFKAQVQYAMAADAHLGLGDKCDTLEGPWLPPEALNEQLTVVTQTKLYTVRYRTLRTDPYTLVG